MIKKAYKGERKNLWLNVRNPLYRDILMQLDAGNRYYVSVFFQKR